jgi:hypothetical protein
MKTSGHPIDRWHLYSHVQVGVHILHIPDTAGEEHIAFVVGAGAEVEVVVIADAVLVDDEDALAVEAGSKTDCAHCKHEIEDVVAGTGAGVEVEPATGVETVETVLSLPPRRRTDNLSILTPASATMSFPQHWVLAHAYDGVYYEKCGHGLSGQLALATAYCHCCGFPH